LEYTIKLFVLHGNIDQTLVNSLHSLLTFVYRWIRLWCYDNRVYISCSLNTHVTPDTVWFIL